MEVLDNAETSKWPVPSAKKTAQVVAVKVLHGKKYQLLSSSTKASIKS